MCFEPGIDLYYEISVVLRTFSLVLLEDMGSAKHIQDITSPALPLLCPHVVACIPKQKICPFGEAEEYVEKRLKSDVV